VQARSKQGQAVAWHGHRHCKRLLQEVLQGRHAEADQQQDWHCLAAHRSALLLLLLLLLLLPGQAV
jgi:hypothetical protein